MIKANTNYLFAVMILVVWLVVCATAFWWFQLRHIAVFDEYWATFDGAAFQATNITPSDDYRAVVMHFIDEECPCSRFANPHIADLEQAFSADVEFIRYDPEQLQQLSHKALEVPASPAVAIWDQSGRLAYLGPYSSGAICGQGKDFVVSTLSSLKHNHNPEWYNQEAVGCFCQWPVT